MNPLRHAIALVKDFKTQVTKFNQQAVRAKPKAMAMAAAGPDDQIDNSLPIAVIDAAYVGNSAGCELLDIGGEGPKKELKIPLSNPLLVVGGKLSEQLITREAPV